jgi:hypothetical protein
MFDEGRRCKCALEIWRNLVSSANTRRMQARFTGRVCWWEELWTPSSSQRHRSVIGNATFRSENAINPPSLRWCCSPCSIPTNTWWLEKIQAQLAHPGRARCSVGLQAAPPPNDRRWPKVEIRGSSERRGSLSPPSRKPKVPRYILFAPAVLEWFVGCIALPELFVVHRLR